MSDALLSDAEIDAICAGLRQSAAMVRFLKRLGVRVDRKPNGRPLVRRADWEHRGGLPAQNPKLLSNGPKWSRAA